MIQSIGILQLLLKLNVIIMLKFLILYYKQKPQDDFLKNHWYWAFRA